VRKLRRIIPLIGGLALVGGYFAALSGPEADGQRDLENLISKMERAAERQRSRLCAYSVNRCYTLRNKHLNPDAQMDVRLTYERGEGKHFQIVSIQAEGVTRRSLENLLNEEARTGKAQQASSEVNSSNYQFELLGFDNCGDQQCYKLQLKARHNSKYLIDGTAWVSAKDFAIVRIVGRLAKSPSFWLSRPKVEQTFEKIDGFWLPSYNHSSTAVLFLGEADLTIEYSGYEVTACKDAGEDNRPQ
jgi:hypothetical protein